MTLFGKVCRHKDECYFYEESRGGFEYAFCNRITNRERRELCNLYVQIEYMARNEREKEAK